MDNATKELKSFKNIDFDDMDDLTYDDELSKEEPQAKVKKESPYAERKAIETPVETKSDTVTFKKESKKTQKNEIAKNEKSDDSKGDA